MYLYIYVYASIYIYIYYVYRHNIYIYIHYIYIYIYTLCIYIDMYIYIYMHMVFKIHNMFEVFDWVFRVAPIWWKEHCFWRWSLVWYTHTLQPVTVTTSVQQGCLSYVRLLCLGCLLYLLCLAHLWVSEYVGGFRISFEACGISF